MSHVSHLLERAESGDPRAAADLLPLVYDELRRIAARQMAKEPRGHTLQPTALVHEAWLRLGADQQAPWQDRAYFLGAAAEAMRRILLERARRKLRPKHGGGQDHEPFDETGIQPPAKDETVLQVNDALDRLTTDNPEMARIVKLRFFAGLSNEETAVLLGVNERTVRRKWELAKVYLYDTIQGVH